MATPREYFDLDAPTALTAAKVLMLSADQFGADVRVVIDGGNSTDGTNLGRIYLPNSPHAASIIAYFLNHPAELIRSLGVAEPMTNQAEHLAAGNTRLIPLQLNVYTAAYISREEQARLEALARASGLIVLIRDYAYCSVRASREQPEAFILHEARDKDSLVRRLAVELQSIGLTTWYDEFSVVTGQSVRATFARGVKECGKCILVLSPYLCSHRGRIKTEFNEIFTRELIDEKNLIVPVWLGVSDREVYGFSPSLADKIGIPATLAPDEIARRIQHALDLKA